MNIFRLVPLAAVLLVVVFGSLLGSLLELESLAEMVSIGTLVALTFVCATVLLLRYDVGGDSKKPTACLAAIVVCFVIASILFRVDQRIAAGVFYALGFFAMVCI